MFALFRLSLQLKCIENAFILIISIHTDYTAIFLDHICSNFYMYIPQFRNLLYFFFFFFSFKTRDISIMKMFVNTE